MTTNSQHTTDDPTSDAALTVLVTGATGRTGSRVAQAARAAGHTVRAASRSGEVHFDWHERSTWDDALRGADAAYLTYFPDVGAPGAADAVGALARRAAELGVRHLVLLSARGEDQARATEHSLAESGVTRWTVVRASWFAQNFSEGPLVDGLRAGELVFPAGEVLEPFVDVRDIADVVVAVLAAGERYAGRIVEVSGARLLSFRDAVAELSAAIGKPLVYVPVGAREYGAVLTDFGVPEEEVEFLIELFETNLDGRNAHVSDGVREVLGREPREFSAFVREAADAGVWKA
ncbi:NmrA family NAD(P)-binding protein [Streptomyces sp. AN091965]|uniref:NmrA family NAD(P)-binding protein n=1 Tax=Streptomyces sp. AN091965 TaxID=2927803 RepID=UPI001F61C735|nr:NmrA family transcriptional regulator [Streptomyces sp. AN091965]MCI3933749.1 NmrA family transcriptional regulator [Streptomyces sp. AN091965]